MSSDHLQSIANVAASPKEAWKPIDLASTRRLDGTQSKASLAASLGEVRKRIDLASTRRLDGTQSNVRLVAVSKTKPVELLQVAHDAGCRVFGENYVQELVEKVPHFDSDVKWHYIGSLQSNKVNMLLKPFLRGNKNIEQLIVETVGSSKLANKLNNAASTATDHKLKVKVFVQVNTSGEVTKSGIRPGEECVTLCRYISQNCPHLQLMGLMTIGAVGDTSCFNVLAKDRTNVAAALGVSADSLELSMGMSGDFEEAIAAGSTNVRVGTAIFGAREYSNKK